MPIYSEVGTGSGASGSSSCPGETEARERNLPLQTSFNAMTLLEWRSVPGRGAQSREGLEPMGGEEDGGDRASAVVLGGAEGESFPERGQSLGQVLLGTEEAAGRLVSCRRSLCPGGVG